MVSSNSERTTTKTINRNEKNYECMYISSNKREDLDVKMKR